ncbi:MAG: ABC transporter permease [Clostridium sp.]|nr:ABC transporter permease [Clostridium sp.]
MKLKKGLNIVIGLSILLVFWCLISSFGEAGKSSVPSPLKVVLAIQELIEDHVLFEYIGISLYRFFIGYLSSVIVAIILGLILGWFPRAWDIIDPIVQVLRPISPTAWFPFIVIAFGIGNLPAIVIIFISAFFPVLLSTVSAVKKIDPIYLKVADNFEITGLKIIFKIILPSIFPYIANAMHIALGSAWIFLVAGEMVGAQSGLGYLIIDARNNLRSDTLLAGIVFIGIIGLLLDKLIGYLEKRISVKWGRFN